MMSLLGSLALAGSASTASAIAFALEAPADHIGLESRSCECHAAVKKEYDRMLPPTIVRQHNPLKQCALEHGERGGDRA